AIVVIVMWAALVLAGVQRQFLGTVMFLGLPFAGGLGAYLSRKRDRSRWAILASGLFPASLVLCVAAVVVSLAAVLGWLPTLVPSELIKLGDLMAGFVLGLLLGVVPFLCAEQEHLTD